MYEHDILEYEGFSLFALSLLFFSFDVKISAHDRNVNFKYRHKCTRTSIIGLNYKFLHMPFYMFKLFKLKSTLMTKKLKNISACNFILNAKYQIDIFCK